MNDISDNPRKQLFQLDHYAPFLPIYFALPSYLQFQIRAVSVYAFICLAGLAGQLMLTGAEERALALGLALPGAGFLQWAAEGQIVLSLIIFAGISSLFALALIIWFATGNILLPPLVWIGAALAAAHPTWFGLQPNMLVADWRLSLPFALPFMAITIVAVSERGWLKPKLAVPTERSLHPALPMALRDEIALDDLRRLRVLLDRALQPIECFDGFEWRDQFQTAAIRYQINFLSYALSVAQQHYLPAATAYYSDAQVRLLAKQGNLRIWRYWALENMWGNLRLNRDPVPQDNIMFTGFVGLQMALARTGAPLVLFDGNKKWRQYQLNEMADLLASQYASAPYGLLACEPNWIYPLCNIITACGMRAADRQDGGERWVGVADKFRESLNREFTDRSGNFIAFRSSITGFAPPSLGGAVMQAFPCLFLNSLYPDLAAARWEQLCGRLATQNWKRAFWPIDVGNYGFSRASSYAASAAAAVEMGDGEMVKALLDRLEEECPSQTMDGVTHRKNASLWAHALELTARLGRNDGLRIMLDRPISSIPSGPYISTAPYPDVMVARATSAGQQLELVLYPISQPQHVTITIAGLCPGRHYRVVQGAKQYLQADQAGTSCLSMLLAGRTELTITPVI